MSAYLRPARRDVRPVRVVDFEEVLAGEEIRVAWSNGWSERMSRERFLAWVALGFATGERLGIHGQAVTTPILAPEEVAPGP